MLSDQLAISGSTGLTRQPAAVSTSSSASSTAQAGAAASANASASAASNAVANPSSITATAVNATGDTSPADAAALKKSAAALNAGAQPQHGSIEFSVDQSSGKTLLKVVDPETNTVLLQIPSKVALALSQDTDKRQGLLIKDSA
jgi:flagellar protein FlaG